MVIIHEEAKTYRNQGGHFFSAAGRLEFFQRTRYKNVTRTSCLVRKQKLRRNNQLRLLRTLGSLCGASLQEAASQVGRFLCLSRQVSFSKLNNNLLNQLYICYFATYF